MGTHRLGRGADQPRGRRRVASAPAAPGTPRSWAAVAAHWAALSELLQADPRAIGVLGLPWRLAALLRLAGVATLGQLLALPFAELPTRFGVGRLGITHACAALAALPRAALFAQDAQAWRAELERALAALDPREQHVLQARCGLLAPVRTSAVLAAELGVSRARAGQLERRALLRLRGCAPWLGAAVHRALLPSDGPWLLQDDAAIARLQLAAPQPTDREVLRYFLVQYAPEYDLRPVLLEGQRTLARETAAQLAARLKELRRASLRLPLPIDVASFEPALAAATGQPVSAVRALRPWLAAALQIRGVQIVAIGHSRRDAILAFLRDQTGPVRVSSLYAAVGRGVLPPEVLWVQRGAVALRESLPDFDAWRGRVGPAVVALMLAEAGGRQWSTAELYLALAAQTSLPAWLTPHTLRSLLHDEPALRYLGRNVLVLATAEPTSRRFIAAAIEHELRAAGVPCLESEILAAVRTQRSLAIGTWKMQRLRAPFVLLGSGKIGLFPRDFAGGEAAASTFRDGVARWLGARTHAAARGEFRAYLLALAQGEQAITLELALSLLRQDPRFRLGAGGSLKLTAVHSQGCARE